MSLQYCTKLSEGDIAPYVLLPGDPKRVEKVAKIWDKARLVADNREMITYTGEYKGMPISCTSTGMGCPSTAIAIEELARVGAKNFLRIGTCGTFQDGIEKGSMLIFDSAARYDGTSKLYAPIEYPAVAHYEVIQACIEAAKKCDYSWHVGATRTSDSFYGMHPHPGSSFNDFWQSNWKEFFADMKRLNIVGAEMEASIILVLSKIWGLRAGAIAVTLDNIFEASTDVGFDPETALDKSADNEEKLARMGSEALHILWEEDKKKGNI